ncbi:hypothetical protein GWO43_15810 [candidate division KSB1 bacterium]|nr:hypothetical protein [candidate division KSB1 bacterium]NIR68580.1 hypothetical protein [candidate division KSB1 bacterium]NIS25417.1 hypothetical protein [candidate division KSB1 bacterium]NIT72309.1 hypothetical protein [candidate division KSB1 bacterium]NIU26093.1 hypothetical protein [candidate division KSB1 bacterium]
MTPELSNSDRKRFEFLLTKAIDGELQEEEWNKFQQFVENYPECEKEWQQQMQLKEVTKTMKLKAPSGEVWDNYWVNVYNRLERGFAWIVFSIGFIILLTYGGFKAVEAIIAEPQLAGVVKAGIVLTIGGLVMLLVSIIREKLFTFKHDPYKEVKR